MKKRRIDYQPLVGIKWADMHCGQLAHLAVCEALGCTIPEEAFWLDPEARDEDVAQGRLETYLERCGEWWERLGPDARLATCLGDVILYPLSLRNRPHLGVLVDEKDGWVLTTTKSSGAVLQRRSSIARCAGVFRFRPDTLG